MSDDRDCDAVEAEGLESDIGVLLREDAFMRAGNASADSLEHDPEKWVPAFPRDKRETFARKSRSNNELERDDDSS
jgi:hypothetical protein